MIVYDSDSPRGRVEFTSKADKLVTIKMELTDYLFLLFHTKNEAEFRTQFFEQATFYKPSGWQGKKAASSGK